MLSSTERSSYSNRQQNKAVGKKNVKIFLKTLQLYSGPIIGSLLYVIYICIYIYCVLFQWSMFIVNLAKVSYSEVIVCTNSLS